MEHHRTLVPDPMGITKCHAAILSAFLRPVKNPGRLRNHALRVSFGPAADRSGSRGKQSGGPFDKVQRAGLG